MHQIILMKNIIRRNENIIVYVSKTSFRHLKKLAVKDFTIHLFLSTYMYTWFGMALLSYLSSAFHGLCYDSEWQISNYLLLTNHSKYRLMKSFMITLMREERKTYKSLKIDKLLSFPYIENIAHNSQWQWTHIE